MLDKEGGQKGERGWTKADIKLDNGRNRKKIRTKEEGHQQTWTEMEKKGRKGGQWQTRTEKSGKSGIRQTKSKSWKKRTTREKRGQWQISGQRRMRGRQ